MPDWTHTYCSGLEKEFDALKGDLPKRLQQVTSGSFAPALADLPIGSARELSAAVLFFDIVNSSGRTPTSKIADLKRSLLTLNCVIPLMSRIVTDHGGFIEKNTGDGLMAIVGAAESQVDAANAALDAAVTMLFALRELVNPYLLGLSIEPVSARIGIDYGKLLIARIGLPTGSADHNRNFLTAIGPVANIASRLQELASADGIAVGQGIRAAASVGRGAFFQALIPTDWPWVFEGTTDRYWVWRYTEIRSRPFLSSLLAGLVSGDYSS